MKKTAITIFAAILTALIGLVAPATAASATPAVHHASVRPAQQTLVYTACDASDNTECLNLIQCYPFNGVQLWNIDTAGACGEQWGAQESSETVNPSQVWPFYCGDGLNSAYAGDAVEVIDYYDGSNDAFYVPKSAGSNNTVTVVPYNTATPTDGGTYQGLFVVQDSSPTDTRLIDVATTCTTGEVQHLYAGCNGDGCLVREGLNPSNEYWDLREVTVSSATRIRAA
jgi:hypothetical protein